LPSTLTNRCMTIMVTSRRVKAYFRRLRNNNTNGTHSRILWGPVDGRGACCDAHTIGPFPRDVAEEYALVPDCTNHQTTPRPLQSERHERKDTDITDRRKQGDTTTQDGTGGGQRRGNTTQTTRCDTCETHRHKKLTAHHHLMHVRRCHPTWTTSNGGVRLTASCASWDREPFFNSKQQWATGEQTMEATFQSAPSEKVPPSTRNKKKSTFPRLRVANSVHEKKREKTIFGGAARKSHIMHRTYSTHNCFGLR
jgi:hypothetical protein